MWRAGQVPVSVFHLSTVQCSVCSCFLWYPRGFNGRKCFFFVCISVKYAMRTNLIILGLMVDMMWILIGDVCEDSVREKWSKAESSFSSLKCLRCDADENDYTLLIVIVMQSEEDSVVLEFYGNDRITSQLIWCWLAFVVKWRYLGQFIARFQLSWALFQVTVKWIFQRQQHLLFCSWIAPQFFIAQHGLDTGIKEK